MYCADCGKKWSGGIAPGIGPVCDCGSDDFISQNVYDRWATADDRVHKLEIELRECKRRLNKLESGRQEQT